MSLKGKVIVVDHPGIGEAKANALVGWRQGIEQKAKSSAPTSLSPAESTRIRGKYASLYETIDQQITLSKDEERKERKQILQRHAASRRMLDAEEESARRNFEHQWDALRVKNGEERQKLATESTSVQRALDAEEKSARRDHGIQRLALKARFDKEKERLIGEYRVEKLKAVEAQKVWNAKLDELNQLLLQRRVELRQAERDLEAIKDISPMDFLLLVLLPNRVP